MIKWPGGKTRELDHLSSFLPRFRTLVEPFVGGGALFFAREPERAFLNDASRDLTGFYRAVREGDAALREVLDLFARDRVGIAARARRHAADFARLVASSRATGESGDVSGLVRGRLELPVQDLEDFLAHSVRDKIRRLLGLEAKHDKVFGEGELPPHFETALQAGYYTAVRDHYEPDAAAGPIARFYFLRQLCYGSMFRYSKTGRFNIPYGGISYNRVDLAEKVERLFSPEVRGLLARAEIATGDFEEHLDGIRDRLGPECFVFIDPPYDTEFSDYANRSFAAEDQRRLARVFAGLTCPSLVVIQRTDFVEDLYREAGRKIEARGGCFLMTTYAKKYGYNVRGRNERDTTHLLALNYKPPAGQMSLW